jgi:hypothetical protein
MSPTDNTSWTWESAANEERYIIVTMKRTGLLINLSKHTENRCQVSGKGNIFMEFEQIAAKKTYVFLSTSTHLEN